MSQATASDGKLEFKKNRHQPCLFERIGGLEVMQRVHTRFYDKIYVHPWLGKFFEGHEQQAIELRQTQFMAEKMGATTPYPGRPLPLAHRRMFITEELLNVRQNLLREALQEEALDDALILRWLKIDRAFWGYICNESLEDFEKIDFKYQQPLIVDKPI